MELYLVYLNWDCFHSYCKLLCSLLVSMNDVAIDKILDDDNKVKITNAIVMISSGLRQCLLLALNRINNSSIIKRVT